MKKPNEWAVRFVGLDVHAETIAVAIAEKAREGRFIETVPNRHRSVKRLAKRLPAEGARKAATKRVLPATPFIGNSSSWGYPAMSSHRRPFPQNRVTGSRLTAVMPSALHEAFVQES